MPDSLGLKMLGNRGGPQRSTQWRTEDTAAYKAQHDQLFRKACELAGTPPTRRQYTRYRNQKGLAYAHRRAAQQEMEGQSV